MSIKLYKKLFESLVKPILMYNSEIWYMDFYEKIIRAERRAQIKDMSKFDILAMIDSSQVEKTHLKFCKYILGLSKQSVNIAARAELAQYPIDVFIKVQSLKYLARISSDENNPLLYDAFCLSKWLSTNGIFSWFSYVENIANVNKLDINKIQDINYKQEKRSFSKNIKKELKDSFENIFFEKLKLSFSSFLIFFENELFSCL